MRNNAVATTKYFIVSIFTALAVVSTTVIAQGPPIFPDGSKIEGTWNMQVQWIDCDTGDPILQPAPDLRSFARGGAMTEIDSSIWCDSDHCTSLGVWKHLGGRNYISTHKRASFNPVTSEFTHSTIVVSNMTHEPDDTLTASDFLRFLDADGTLTGTRCRTATGARFTGEN
jgi:hypothetical protein